MDDWMKNMWCIYIMRYYSAIKKNYILPFATTWMDLNCIMLIEMSDGERQMPPDFTPVWNLKTKQTITAAKAKLVDTELRLPVTRKEGTWEVNKVGEVSQLYRDGW